MIEVIMLGVQVTLTKIVDYATVIPAVALFVLGALGLHLGRMQSAFEPGEVWERIEWAQAREDRKLANEHAPEAAS